MVFVAESFDLDLARNLTNYILDAQGTGDLKMANASPRPESTPGAPGPSPLRTGVSRGLQPLTSNLVHFMSSCGVMKAAVQAEIKTASKTK
jgi:hypothetical protein